MQIIIMDVAMQICGCLFFVSWPHLWWAQYSAYPVSLSLSVEHVLCWKYWQNPHTSRYLNHDVLLCYPGELQKQHNKRSLIPRLVFCLYIHSISVFLLLEENLLCSPFRIQRKWYIGFEFPTEKRERETYNVRWILEFIL